MQTLKRRLSVIERLAAQAVGRIAQELQQNQALVLDVPTSGSVGNETHSRGRSGQTIRQRAMPTNPNTAAQSAARTRLTTLSAGWRGLTDAQRANWNSFAASYTMTNALGQSFNLTGHQSYIQVNTVNLQNGDAVLTTPPALPSFVAPTITTLTAAAGTAALSMGGTSPANGTKLQFFASAQKSAGVSYMNDFRYLETFTTATSSKFDLLAAYVAKFGALIAGKKIFIQVVQTQNGVQDNGTIQSVIVAA